MLFLNKKINSRVKATIIILLLLFFSALCSCENKEKKDKEYVIHIDNTENIDENIIKSRGGKDYIVDENGKEQEILNNVFDAMVGEVAYFGRYGGVQVPFVVVRRSDKYIEIMSIPSFNLMRDDSYLSLSKMADLESFSLLNTVFYRTCFNNEEREYIIPFEFIDGKVQIEPDKELLKEFSINYDMNYKDKYSNPIILSKILLHENYVNRLYNDAYINDYLDNHDEAMKSIDNMWNSIVKNNAKGITYMYKYKDFVYSSGMKIYDYNSKIELRLKNIETDVYKEKANGFKYIGEGSDLNEKDYGYYYLRDGKIIDNEIVENGGVKYYLSNNGKAVELNKFSIKNIEGTNICVYDDAIVKDKVINENDIDINEMPSSINTKNIRDAIDVESKDNDEIVNRYYIDTNGISHNLISDIKDANISDTVEFGHKIDNVSEPMLWRVVDNVGGVYTLILESKLKPDIFRVNVEKRNDDAYDGKVSEFDTTNTWETSDRRKYLNEVFYENAFSDYEKELIVSNPLRAESYTNESYFSGKGKDVYDKVFIYNENTTKYLKDYVALEGKLKSIRPDIYNDNNKGIDFSLVNNDMKAIRPWIVVNTSENEVPEENNNTNYVNEDSSDDLSFQIPKTSNKSVGSIRFGKYLLFGSEKTKIDWHLIAMDGDIGYFAASKVLDFERIVENKNEEIKWSNSELRKWLNETFINEIFTDLELSKLEKIKKQYSYIDLNGHIKSEECEDIITLLNYDEIPIYLSTGVHLSNKSFEKISDIDKNATSAVTSLFDNRSKRFYSACYKADEVGNNDNGKIEIKVNDSEYLGILPVIAINMNNVDADMNNRIKKNIDKKDELIKETKDNCQLLIKDGLYGDELKIGKYQGKDLEWVVIDRKRDYALVMSKKSLFVDNCLGRYGTSSWETSNVRKKLNTEIFNECFSENEKKKIHPVKLITEYMESDTRKEEKIPFDAYLLDDETIDYLFLPEEGDTNYILKSPLKTPYNEGEVIWLRGGDANGFYASNFREVVELNISRKAKKYNVRPLMWVKYK